MTSRCTAGAHAPRRTASRPRGLQDQGQRRFGLYHVPGSAFYDRTVAEIWFATAEDAEAAGFQLPPSQRDKEDES